MLPDLAWPCPSSETLTAMADSREQITIRSLDGGTEARFAPDANMVCSSFAYRGAELIDERRGLQAYAEHGRTMGIPLLYPWANRLGRAGYRAAGAEVTLPAGDPRLVYDEHGLPMHGVIPGLLRWEASQSHPDRVTARLAWEAPELLELFPFRHSLLYEAAVEDRALTISTTVQASGEVEVPVSFGYHPYLCVPGSGRAEWRITLGVSAQLELDHQMIPTGASKPYERGSFVLGDSGFDDAFEAAHGACFEAAAGGAAVVVEFLQGCAFAQVFTPPTGNSIAFEPMTAPANALNSGTGLNVVAAGSEFRAAFRVRLSGEPPLAG